MIIVLILENHLMSIAVVFFSVLSWRYLFTLELPEFWENKQADQTLEVLMSDLEPAVMDQFFMKDGVSANDVTRVRFILNTSALESRCVLLFLVH